MSSDKFVWNQSNDGGENSSDSGAWSASEGGDSEARPIGYSNPSDEVTDMLTPMENLDPARRRAVQPRRIPAVLRAVRSLLRVHVARRPTPEEQANINEAKARKALETTLAADSKVTAQWMTSCLDRLGICYIRRGSDGDIRKKSSVGFVAVDMEPDALHFHVDMRHLPWGVSVGKLIDKETVDNLSMSVGRAVTVRWTPDSGVIYTVERGSGRMGIRTHIQFLDMLEAMPASADSLAVPVGETNNRRPVYISIGSMPHLLVGGTTGAGKTNFLHVIVNTLVRRNKPDRLKLVLIDLKGGLAFRRYEGLPHLQIIDRICQTGIIERREDVFDFLDWLVQEGERRMRVIGEAGHEDIGQYNARRKRGRLPYMVIVIDEWADMMYGQGKGESEGKLVNVVQRMRAVGIHVILATQVPKSEVITGLIKGNMPARIAFSVPNLHASMAILDSRAAVGLGVVGRCVMQFKDELTIQTPFISPEMIAVTLRGAITGDYGQAEAAHDVTEREVREWAIEHNNGYLTISVLYAHYRERGVTRAELGAWVDGWEGQEFIYGAGTYEVEPASGSRGRRLVIKQEDNDGFATAQ